MRRSARILNVALDDDARLSLARRSVCTPRIHRIGCYATRARLRSGSRAGRITRRCGRCVQLLEVDEQDSTKSIANCCNHHRTRSAAPGWCEQPGRPIHEDKDAIEDIYEPFLIQAGFSIAHRAAALPLPAPTIISG